MYVPSAGEKKYKHGPEAFAGLSFGFGGGPQDADQDGVNDKIDRCPDTPLGARVDATGFPLDSDGDGVATDRRVRSTPSGATVDARAARVTRMKTACWTDDAWPIPDGARVDGHGVPRQRRRYGPDGLDQCERTPPAARESERCPQDRSDASATASTVRPTRPPRRAWTDGCPIMSAQGEELLIREDRLQRHFDTGSPPSARSRSGSRREGIHSQRWPSFDRDRGHTDSRAPRAQPRVSDARAAAVRDICSAISRSFAPTVPRRLRRDATLATTRRARRARTAGSSSSMNRRRSGRNRKARTLPKE